MELCPFIRRSDCQKAVSFVELAAPAQGAASLEIWAVAMPGPEAVVSTERAAQAVESQTGVVVPVERAEAVLPVWQAVWAERAPGWVPERLVRLR